MLISFCTRLRVGGKSLTQHSTHQNCMLALGERKSCLASLIQAVFLPAMSIYYYSVIACRTQPNFHYIYCQQCMMRVSFFSVFAFLATVEIDIDSVMLLRDNLFYVTNPHVTFVGSNLLVSLKQHHHTLRLFYTHVLQDPCHVLPSAINFLTRKHFSILKPS